MTTAGIVLLLTIAVILLFGFVAIGTVLVEIRDKMGETNGHVERLADEIVEDDDE